MISRTPSQMTLGEIKVRLEEAEINFRSLEGEGYDLSNLQDEKDELELAVENGDYLNCEEE